MRHRAPAWGKAHRSRALHEYKSQRRRTKTTARKAEEPVPPSGSALAHQPISRRADSRLLAAVQDVAQLGAAELGIAPGRRPPLPRPAATLKRNVDSTAYSAFEPARRPGTRLGFTGTALASARGTRRSKPDLRNEVGLGHGLGSQRTATLIVAGATLLVLLALVGSPATWLHDYAGEHDTKVKSAGPHAPDVSNSVPRGLSDWHPHPTRHEELDTSSNAGPSADEGACLGGARPTMLVVAALC